MFSRILIANRGEIALRVIRTARRLGISTVAVYSDADADAAHVRAADVAVRLGPAAASASYLDIDRVVDAAKQTGAEAIHPGYGFLSENAAFARRLEEEGIVFLGPTAASIETMGDKISAKQAVASRGVPLVPGVAGAGLSDAELIARADEVGYPILVKPSAGGGGKGMREVYEASQLPEALASARREAASSFGDDTLFLERLVASPRHIEVQVLADSHGNVIHLGERECSLQRRHQKVIEEAPSALLDAETRARIGAAAVETAKACDYRGAGTVEFIVGADRPDEFFFMEMNTRLQVEHPVTEQVTGYDLVEWQLRIGAGEQLAIVQDDVTLRGHSIEARIYAEDPSRGFLPTGGTALDVVFPEGEGIRIDAGLEPGQRIASDYDPMIAKLIVTADDRAQALARMQAALAQSAVPGIVTNIDFLRTLLAQDEVVAGELDTRFIDRMDEAVLTRETGEDSALVAAAAVAVSLGAAGESDAAAEPASAWDAPSAWRSLADPHVSIPFVVDGERIDAVYRGEPVTVGDDGRWSVVRDGRRIAARVWADAATRSVWVSSSEGVRQFVRPQADTALDPGAAGAEILAPMPGSVIDIRAEDGATVSAGDPVLVVEAMKMEHVLTAPADGVVSIRTAVGAQVALDEVLAAVVDPEAADTATADPEEGTR